MTITQELINAERKLAEQQYTVTAFDYERNPVGSFEWAIYWKGWQAAISQHKAMQDGWVLVPKEPTRETLIALRTAYENALDDSRTPESFIVAAKAAYEIIAAAPSDNKALVENSDER